MEIPRISDAEWQVMRIVWKYKEVSANEIIEELVDKVQWKPKTVKSLISRLLGKDAIGYTKIGKEYLYHALVSEEDSIKVESESFIDKVFNGSINSLLLHFVESKGLSDKDIEELKGILKKAEK